METLIFENEAYIRGGFFFGVFLVMALWEWALPRRLRRARKAGRWFINLSITFLNTFIIRFVVPVSAVTAALAAEHRGLGLMNTLGLDGAAAGLAAVLLLDLTIYAQHVVFHRVGFLWRLHMVHHTDLDVDVTTGARFHPVEIILSMAIKIFVVVLIGAPAWSVVVFEVVLNAMAMFNHSNARLNRVADGSLRKVIVTPDMHRVHHSVIVRETNSNFGFNLSLWDRLFKTYRAQPAEGHGAMTIGLDEFRDERLLTLPYILKLPLLGRRR